MPIEVTNDRDHETMMHAKDGVVEDDSVNDLGDNDSVRRDDSTDSDNWWSNYESNDDYVDIITDLKDEPAIAKVARWLKGQEYVPFIDDRVVLTVGQVFDDYKHFWKVSRDYMI